MSKSWRHGRGPGKMRHRYAYTMVKGVRRFKVVRERAHHGRRNPEVPFQLCDLNNPRRWHKRTLRRSWRHRDRLHEAVDDLNLEKAMRRRRRNPMPTRRNCDMTFLSQEQEDRIVRRISSARNPGGSPRAARAWWKKLSRQKKLQVARTVLGRMNPVFGANPKRRGAKARRFTSDQQRTKHFRRDEQRRRARARDAEYRSEGEWHGGGWFDDRLNRDMANPKRDGTPTRGEKRKVKYVEYLRTIVDKSKNAELEYKRLTGAVAQAGKEIGVRATNRVMREHAADWDEKREAPAAAPAAAIAEVVAEHPELKFIASRIADLDSTIEHFKQEIRDLPADDDMSEDEEARLQEEIAKLARQKQKLRTQLATLQPVAATNPGRRRGHGRRISSRTISVLRRLSQRAEQACRALRSCFISTRSRSSRRRRR